jgi:hypothetical protein
VQAAVPVKWRSVRLDRSFLASFVFEPEDLIVVLGQDGLVANVAKYLQGQLVLGVNPDPQRIEGVLVPHRPEMVKDILPVAFSGHVTVEERSMVEASLDDGQRLLALNEIFLGHRSHQSARYRIRAAEHVERHSSSGLIVATGTGATGWAKSIQRGRAHLVPLPNPSEKALVFFVREAWPSRWTQAELTEGTLTPGTALELNSEMNEGGVIFGDGIEIDSLEFAWGMRAKIGIAEERLRCVK